MSETELAHPTDPFLQGDIIRLVDRDERDADPAYGIIINADCDLAHCKIDGVVSYLPLFSFDYYFQTFWIPAYIAERKYELLQSVAQICELEKEQSDDLANWIHEDAPSAVVAKLAAAYSVREGALRPKILELHTIEQCPNHDLQLLVRLIELQGRTKDELLPKYATRALKSLGDGHFFINEIVDVPSIGFVARMRRIYSISADLVYPSISQFRLRTSNAPETIFAVRIAKLSNLYRFKIAQLFAYQFSRIGLPDEITALNEIAVQAAVIQIGAQP